MSDPFLGAALKLQRAKQHIDDLNRKSAEFFNGGACAFLLVRDFEREEGAIVFKQKRPIPDEFGLLIGDAVHNLQCALDHLTWAIIFPLVQDARRKTQIHFPFCKTAKDFESVINNRMIQLAGPKVVQAFHDLQPYQGGNDDLVGLHNIDIADKHQILTPVVSAGILTGSKVPNLDTNTDLWKQMRKHVLVGLEDGAELTRVPWPAPPPHLRILFQKENNIGGEFTIAFDNSIEFRIRPVIPALIAMTNAVIAAVAKIALATK